MFSQASVILSIGGHGRHPPCPVHAGIHPPCPVHAGIHTPRQTPPLERHPPWADNPLPSACWDTPPTLTATAADGTHPTGMHSCSTNVMTI